MSSIGLLSPRPPSSSTAETARDVEALGGLEPRDETRFAGAQHHPVLAKAMRAPGSVLAQHIGIGCLTSSE
jgi:hypothetical protein